LAEAIKPVGVVAGVSGGIGRALAEAMVDSRCFSRVIGLSRQRPADWREDDSRAWAHLDLLDETTIAQAATHIARIGQPTRIIVATGVLSDANLAPEKSMRALNADAMARSFAINAIGPALIAKHLLPLTPRDRPSLFAALSARVGSIGDDRLGGWYGYRASKAALNMMVRNLAIEHRRTRPLGVCVALHPGTVKTRLSAPFENPARSDAALTPDRSAAALLEVIDRLGPDDSGGFFAWDGERIEW